MGEDITMNFKNPVNRTPNSEHDRLNNKKTMNSAKITKKCVDQLIKDIDKALKTSK